MDILRVLFFLEKRACHIINEEHRSNFYDKDRKEIENTQGSIRFIWEVHSEGTALYLFNDENWIKKYQENLLVNKEKNRTVFYYIYNRQNLIHLYEYEVSYIVNQRLKLQNRFQK